VGPEEQETFLKELTTEQLLALPYIFAFWAMPHQLPPTGDWRTWVIMGGRGAGKTRAGAEWVRSVAEGPTPFAQGLARRIAIVADTLDQAREVTIFGESGIMAISPQDMRPSWIAGRRMLLWPNGATAQIFSAADPESLRGPQFDAAWADELGKWRNGEATWDMLQFGMRLGVNPQSVVTTTPANVPVLRDLLARASTVVTHATTMENAANLAPGFLEEITDKFAGTRMGRQELQGILLSDVEGALWTNEQLALCEAQDLPKMSRVVVAVDPPVTGKKGSDACGIVVVGAVTDGPVKDWRAYVLEDATVECASPNQWAEAAVAAMERHSASRMVAEVNQGGDMVEAMIRQVDPLVSYKAVHASKGKVVRAEPVAALYEQGRVHHVRGLGDLEDQMCLMSTKGFLGKGSPDRVDALVWALYDLMVLPSRGYRSPQMRAL